MRRLPVLLACLILLPALAMAEGTNFGSMENFKQGAGGRASGMGGAYVAAVDDVTAAYWNPAGLSGMERYTYQLGLNYAILPNQVHYSYAGYAFQVPQIGNYAITWMNFTIGDLEARDAQGEELSPITSSENAFVFSYGRKVYQWLKGLSVGANLKVLYYGLGEFTAVGHGLDLGAQWQPVLYWDHTVGLVVQNVFQRLYWNGGGTDPSLMNVKVGGAFRFLRSNDELFFNHLVSTVDLEFAENAKFNVRAGAEYWYVRSIGVRAGYNGSQITVGASYAPDMYEIDYSYHYDLTELGNNQHLLSLMIRLK